MVGYNSLLNHRSRTPTSLAHAKVSYNRIDDTRSVIRSFRVNVPLGSPIVDVTIVAEHVGQVRLGNRLDVHVFRHHFRWHHFRWCGGCRRGHRMLLGSAVAWKDGEQ